MSSSRRCQIDVGLAIVGLIGLSLVIALIGIREVAAKADAPTGTLGYADLTVQISVEPLDAIAGQEVTVTALVANQGTAPARDFCNYLYIDPVDRPPQLATPDTARNCIYASLGAGSSYTFHKTFILATDGLHSAYFWLDRNNTVTESSEGNNLALMIFGRPTSSGEVDTYEPDDSCGAARHVNPDGVAYRHTLWPVGDEDWIRVDMVQNLEYTITTSDVGLDGNTTIALYDECNEPPMTYGDSTFGRGAQLTWRAATTAPHYIHVEHLDASYGPDTHYDLSVSAACTGDSYEPDDTCQSARETAADGSFQDHLFCTSGDEDWIRFRARAGMTYHIDLENIGAAAQPRLALYARCGAEPISEAAVGAAIDWPARAGGLYYVQVSDADPASYGPSAYYRLRLSADGQEPDPFEPDNQPVDAQAVPTDGAPQLRTISPTNDQDWFYFMADSGESFRIETFDLGPVSDTVLCLYDSDGTVALACDDDGGAGLGSRLQWRASRSGRYHIKIRDYRPEVGGAQASYRLAVTTSASACDADSWEADSSYYQAVSIATDGTWQHRNTCPAGDTDWVRFWAPAGRTYAIETANLGLNADTVLTLYDVDGQTPLWTNDDVGTGRASRILWRFQREGVYYVKMEPYTAASSGRGAEYDLRVSPSTVMPTPTSTPPPSPTPTPTKPPSPTPTPTALPSAQTLLVTNLERFRAIYGDTATTTLTETLIRLAGDAHVKGMLLDVNEDAAAAAAYTAWIAAPTDTAKANLVSDAIRNLVMRNANRNPDLAYIVLIGDDRIIPFHRVADRPGKTGAYESRYTPIAPGSTVGSALKDNMSLNDDFYADREPTIWDGQLLYLPDYAIGRLVESPSDIIGAIYAFLTSPTLTVNKAMVAGYDVMADGAQQVYQQWRQAGVPGLDGALVGGNWGAPELQDRQLRAVPRFDLQALVTGANHYIEGSPKGSRTYAQDIVNAPADLNGVLIWNLGRYTGLNVPPGYPESDLDLPEAFARKGANYIGNTGGTLVGKEAPLYAERLMKLFAEELTAKQETSAGEAWICAKRRYYLEALSFNEGDRKVLSVATLYGLPMTGIDATDGSLSAPFPSVDTRFGTPGTFGNVISATLQLTLTNGLASLVQQSGPAGAYFSLDGHAAFAAGQATQPQFYDATSNWALGTPRGVIWREGQYADAADFTPLRPQGVVLDQIGATAADTPAGEPQTGWAPGLPVFLAGDAGDMFSLFLGQYNEDQGRQRLYTDMTFDIYFSDSPDYAPPTATWVAGRRTGPSVAVKVEAEDSSGIQRVIATHACSGCPFTSTDLRYDPAMHKWIGEIPTARTLTWFVTVVDGAGNVTYMNNKGKFYQTAGNAGIYLPVILR